MNSSQNPADCKTWEQLPDESDSDYRKFLYYLRLGPQRTIARAFAVATGLDPAVTKVASSTWRNLSAANDWRSRAAAWDIDIASSQCREAACLYVEIIRDLVRAGYDAVKRGSARIETLGGLLEVLNSLSKFLPNEVIGALTQGYSGPTLTAEELEPIAADEPHCPREQSPREAVNAS